MSRAESFNVECVEAKWPAPDKVIAFTTTRRGGVSVAPFDSWNLAEHVGDNPQHVAQNRRRLKDVLPPATQLNWLDQVHGIEVKPAVSQLQRGDGLFSAQPLQACCIMTADCVPILLCSTSGEEVAALHAGWRGVAGRIIEHGVAQFSRPPSELMVWIGPSISVDKFRIGIDVMEKLRASMRDASDSDHLFRQDPHSLDHAYANLQGIVERQCRELGITQIYQSNRCSVSEQESFYSYRREQETGRNVSVIVVRG